MTQPAAGGPEQVPERKLRGGATTRPGQAQRTPPRFVESVRAAAWLYFVLSTPIGVVLAVITAVAVTDSVTGGEAVAFYIVLGGVALFLMFALINFTNLVVAVTDTGVHFAFGVFNKRVGLSDITFVEARDYRWTEYGGWGIRWALKGKRAWSVPGAKRGVLITLSEKGRERSYFISSRRPEELAQAIKEARSGAPPV
jgi:hypothetical protein